MNNEKIHVMRVYVILFFTLLLSLTSHAGDNDEHEVKVVGDKNYSNNATLVYDGIDVSNYQKDINWRATAADPSIKYVYVKATEGATHKQHRYRANIENARKHGVKVGSYHFLKTTSSIQKQFENFISMAKPEEQDLIPLLDVETHAGWSAKQLQDSVMLFCQLLEDYYGCKPMIYTNVSYFNTLLGYNFKHFPLFIARYSKSEPQLNFGAKWILWQFSDKGIISGIDEKVDLSRFNRGCSLKDITYHSPRSKKKNDKPRNHVPRPKPRKEEPKPEVPYPPTTRDNYNSNKEKTEAQKRGEENAKKRQKMEEKRRKEEEKAQEKARKEEEKRRKEIEKREKELEKKRQEIEKKQREQEEKLRKEEEKRRKEEEKRRKEEEKRKARDNATARMKADKERSALASSQQQNDLEQKRRDDLERAKQERIASEKSKEVSSTSGKKSGSKSSTKKYSNQSSADNDEIRYNRNRK